MACDIANGRKEQCKDSVGGIDAVFFVNYGDYDPEVDVTYDVTNTDLITEVANVTSLYKYELKGNNGFSEKPVTSRENGTTYIEQTLSVEFKKLDVTMHKTFKLLAYGRPNIVIKTRTNKYFLAGLERGMDLTDGLIDNGVALGDFNGYKLTFTGMENIPANFLDCTSDATLISGVFTGATIVTV